MSFNSLFYPVLTGVLAFLIGQACLKRAIEPWVEYRSVIGRIAFGLLQYAQVVSISDKTEDPKQQKLLSDASKFFREQGGDLFAAACSLPWPISKFVVGKTKKACAELIAMSNSVGGESYETFSRCKSKLIKLLGLPDLK